MNRSIEGDASIRVWVAPNGTNAFHVFIIRVPGKHSLGQSIVQLRGHELKSQCIYFPDILIHGNTYGIYTIDFTYKPMIIHQLYVDRFSQCISQVTKAYSHGIAWSHFVYQG